MREHKYRAWDKYAKKWLFGYDLPNLGGFSMFGEVMVMNEWSSAAWSHVKGKLDIELMQYTGLKDKNGVEIYEGDIVAWNTGEKFSVVWFAPHAKFLYRYIKKGYGIDNDAGSHEVEVIGNIYENPELLK